MDVTVFRGWGRLFEGTELVFTGVILFVLTREVDAAINPIATVVRSFVPAEPLVLACFLVWTDGCVKSCAAAVW